jgi:hypothetical protein
VNDQWLTTPQAIEHSYDVVDLGSEHGIVKWSREGLAVQKLQGPSFEWSLDLSPQTQEALLDVVSRLCQSETKHSFIVGWTGRQQ